MGRRVIRFPNSELSVEVKIRPSESSEALKIRDPSTQSSLCDATAKRTSTILGHIKKEITNRSKEGFYLYLQLLVRLMLEHAVQFCCQHFLKDVGKN